MNEIHWPKPYLPGTTDNFISNEVIVGNLSASQVWPFLNNATCWPSYYENASEIEFQDDAGPELCLGTRFHFTTFGMKINAEVTEHVPPSDGVPARVSFRAWIDDTAPESASALHAWLLEDLPGGRLRVLTQESQLGEVAKKMAAAKPNPGLNAHQDWLEGLVGAAAKGG